METPVRTTPATGASGSALIGTRQPNGRICIGKRKINFSTVFAGQMAGIREVEDHIWLVTFMD